MMTVSRIFPDLSKDYAYIQSTGFEDQIRFDLWEGIEIEDNIKSDIVLKNKTKKLPDLLGTGSTEFFVSEELKRLIEENCSSIDVKFHHFEIHNRDYFLINNIGLRKAMDLDKSIYTAFPDGYPESIEKLVILEDTLTNYDLFRLYSSPINIFVTNPFKDLITDKELSGIVFYDDSNLNVLS